MKTGYAYEYYWKVSEYTGWRYEYEYGSFADMYQKLLDGEVDLLAGLAWREDRAQAIGYPSEAMGNETYSLVKHDYDESVSSDPVTLGGKRIGVLNNAVLGVLEQYLEKSDVQADVMPFDAYEELFAAFDAGEVDILAAEGDGSYGRDDAEVVASIGSSDYYLCVNVKRPDLLEQLNEAQAQLLADEPNYISSLQQ